MKVDAKRLGSLIIPGVADGYRHPSEADITSIAITIQLEPSEAAKAFVLRYLKVTEESILNQKFRLR